MRLGDQVDVRPSRREWMGQRPELDAPSGVGMGTRAARTGRQAGGEGQAAEDLPLPPPGLAGGLVDGILLGVLAWAVLALTVLPALGGSATELFPTLLVSLCPGGLVGPGLQAALGQRSPARRLAAPARRRQRVVILGGGFGGVA